MDEKRMLYFLRESYNFVWLFQKHCAFSCSFVSKQQLQFIVTW